MRLVMKCGTCLLALSAMLSACTKQGITPAIESDGKTLELNYKVAGSTIQSVSTRAVPGTIAENRVNNIMVLFFAPSENGSGKYIGYASSVTSDDPASASGTSRVSMPSGNDVESAYSLIVLSNYTTYLRIGSSANLDEFLTNTLANKTQLEARALIRGVADSPSGIKATDGLPMCCEYNKASGTNLIYINFKRIVARVDLIDSSPASNFVLKSAQIWNVRKTCTVGSNGYGAESDYTHYRDRVVTTDNARIEGSLYAFENNTLISSSNDTQTTCLIVGGYYNGSPTLSYYRINVVAPGNNQTMGRNHLYTINIKSVAAEGADNPDDAYNKDKSIIKYEINDWDDSFNGMYFFDADGNGLAVSLRQITFANTGGQLDIEVYRIDSPDPTKRITDPWSVAMREGLQGQSFLVNRIVDTERFRIAAPNENATTHNYEGVVDVKWGRITAPVNITQLNYLSQTHGIKIVPTYLRYPSAGGVKEMTISLEGNFSSITANDVAPVIIYSEGGQSWLSTAYNSAKSNTTKGVFVYDVTCEIMPDGKDYRTADLKVTITQEGKTITGSVNATQARSYTPGEEGYIRTLNISMLELIGPSSTTYINTGTTANRYKLFEGMPTDKKNEFDLHFNIVGNEVRKYRIDLTSSMDWRIITPGLSAELNYKVVQRDMQTSTETTLSDNAGSSGIFYKSDRNSIYQIEVRTTSDVVSAWGDSFYIEFENGDTETFRVFQQGIISQIGPNIAPLNGTAIDPTMLFYYETVIMNARVILDRNIGASSTDYYTHLPTTYPKNDPKNRGGYFNYDQAVSTGCPRGFRPLRVMDELAYLFGDGSGINVLVKWTGNRTDDEIVPYENVLYLDTPTGVIYFPTSLPGKVDNNTSYEFNYVTGSSSSYLFSVPLSTMKYNNGLFMVSNGGLLRCTRYK